MKQIRRLPAPDGQSVKYAWRTASGEIVESVFFSFPTHDSICLSSQIGCAMGCTFCATGLTGLARDLTSGEIAEQVDDILAGTQRKSGPLEISFMGMGEPLLNLQHIFPAAEELHRRNSGTIFTMSTIGFPEKIAALSTFAPGFQLQLSLHAPDDSLRSRLIPAATVPLKEVLPAAFSYSNRSGRALYLNYLLLEDVNDSDDCLKALIGLLRPFEGKTELYLKLSRLNPIEGIPYRASGEERFKRFRSACNSAGIETYEFSSIGTDISGGCGELRAKLMKEER